MAVEEPRPNPGTVDGDPENSSTAGQDYQLSVTQLCTLESHLPPREKIDPELDRTDLVFLNLHADIIS